MNYQDEDALVKEERTIEEIQATVLDVRLFEYFN